MCTGPALRACHGGDGTERASLCSSARLPAGFVGDRLRGYDCADFGASSIMVSKLSSDLSKSEALPLVAG